MVSRISPSSAASSSAADVQSAQSAQVEGLVAGARAAQAPWAATPLRQRLAILRRLRHEIALHARQLAQSIDIPNRTVAESLVAEVTPLADAIRFLELEAPRILKPRKHPRRGRPMWLAASKLVTHRDPYGVVLIVAPRNYPLFLAGAHAMQALAAGNAVVVKCSPGLGQCMRLLRDLARDCGLHPALLGICDGDVPDVYAAINAGVDKVVLTGSAAAGRAVLSRLAPDLVPATMELSGCDSVFILPGANLDLAAKALAYGLTFNGSSTCIAPRRCFVPQSLAGELQDKLAQAIARFGPVEVNGNAYLQMSRLVDDAIENGGAILGGAEAARFDFSDHRDGFGRGVRVYPTVITSARPSMQLLSADIFAPILAIVPVTDVQEALSLSERCPYALGASIFGPQSQATALADKLNVGCVTINDVIAPTADARMSFGGRRASGFGATRGEQGLLDLTRPREVLSHAGSFRPHYDPPRVGDDLVFENYLQAFHAPGLLRRVRGAFGCITRLIARGRAPVAPRAAVAPPALAHGAIEHGKN